MRGAATFYEDDDDHDESPPTGGKARCISGGGTVDDIMSIPVAIKSQEPAVTLRAIVEPPTDCPLRRTTLISIKLRFRIHHRGLVHFTVDTSCMVAKTDTACRSYGLRRVFVSSLYTFIGVCVSL